MLYAIILHSVERLILQIYIAPMVPAPSSVVPLTPRLNGDCTLQTFTIPYLVVISGFTKHMVLMASYTLASEQSREAETFGDLIFTDLLIGPFWLTNHEFAHLQIASACGIESTERGSRTWISVSVMLDLLTRAYPDRLIPLYNMYSHHRSQSLGSISFIPLFSPT